MICLQQFTTKYSVVQFLQACGICILCLCLSVSCTSGQLVVNVKNQGGEVYQQNIIADVGEDTVQLDFKQSDGSLVTQFLDFKNEIQILNRLILGDEELQSKHYSILCFVTKFSRSDFVPADAMSKLRQKNPWAVRTPEKNLPKENVTMDVVLDIRSTDWISPHIKSICEDASSTYSVSSELESIVKSNTSIAGLDKINEEYLRTVKPLIPSSESCTIDKVSSSGRSSSNNNDGSCQCHLDQCIGWFPCALKYCNTSHEKSYRCGIHTCRKCTRFYFSVSRADSCILS